MDSDFAANETAEASSKPAAHPADGEAVQLPSKRKAATQSSSSSNNIYTIKASRGRAFLLDRTSAAVNLPTLLPKGLPYSANFVSFEELEARGTLRFWKQDEVSITSEELGILYAAKCLDQNLKPSLERQARFMELVSTGCKGNFFALPENGLAVCSAEAIAHVLSTNKRYSILDLSGNRLRDDGAQFIAALLRVNDTLVHVDLSSNDIGFTGGAAIAEALEDNNTVVSLNLGARSGVNGNHIGSRGAEALGAVLKKNAVLSKLNLSSSGLGPNGVSFIATALVSNVALTHLDLANNNLGYDGGRIVASVLECTTITHLSLHHNAMGDKGGKALFDTLASVIEGGVDVLEHLNVEHNGLGERTAAALQKVLASSLSLRTLQLSGNLFGGASQHIAAGLADNKHITVLSLSECGLREQDGASFRDALSANASLKHLDLSRNKLKDGGTCEVARGLQTNKGLQSLNLSNNKIGAAGGMALAALISTNRVLRELNLKRNALSGSVGEALTESVRGNTVMEKLNVTYNDFSYKSVVNIQEVLVRNEEEKKKLIVPRLQSDIEALAPTEKELAQVEEEVAMERRIIKDMSEQLLRKNEEARVASEKMRRALIELEKTLERVRASGEAAEDAFRQTEDRVTNEIAGFASKKGNMETRIQQEKERADRAHREMDKIRREIRRIEESENKQWAPLLEEIRTTEMDRAREENDAKFEAEKLVSLSLRKKEIEIALRAAQGKRKTTKK